MIFTELIIGIMIGGTAAAIVSFAVGINILTRSRVAQVTAFDIECQSLLDKCIDIDLCDRALIIKMHNGGGRIVAGKSKYASVLFEAHSTNVIAVKKAFKNYELDTEYLQLMHNVQLSRKVIHETAKMPPSMLQRRYTLDGITTAIVPLFCETKGGLYYGSFSTVGPVDEFFSIDKYAALENIIERIAALHRHGRMNKFLH